MAEINVEFVNPLLTATIGILKDVCQLQLNVDKPYVKTTEFDQESILIIVGVTGEMRGQVILAFSLQNACDIASRMMMGMPVTELNDMAMSAISELSNMIMGNAATILSTKGIGIDITPPAICRGHMSIMNSYTKNICVPIRNGSDIIMELDIAVKGDV